MFLNAKKRRLPSLDFVAFGALTFLRAVRKLAIMYVFVAVHALRKLERSLEVPARVAGDTTHLGVLSDQRVFCF